MQWGLPPDTPLMLDRSLPKASRMSSTPSTNGSATQAQPRDLPKFADRLPKLEDIVLDGRSVLGVYSASTVETGVNVRR